MHPSPHRPAGLHRPPPGPPHPHRPPADAPQPPTRNPPRLVPELIAAPARVPGLGEAAFARRRATVALSRELTAGMRLDGRPAAHGDLAAAALSLHRAWLAACETLLAAARTEYGLRFLTRPATRLCTHAPPGALQVAVHGGTDPTAWLAHPRTFAVLHAHLHRLTGATPRYVAPRRGVLVATSEIGAHALGDWARAEAKQAGKTALSGRFIEYARGFPRLVSGHAAAVATSL